MECGGVGARRATGHVGDGGAAWDGGAVGRGHREWDGRALLFCYVAKDMSDRCARFSAKSFRG